MARKTEDPFMAEMKKLQAAKKLIIGTERTMKLLKQKALAKVYVTKNCPQNVQDKIKQHTDAEVVILEKQNSELGMICKKPFAISVVGVTR